MTPDQVEAIMKTKAYRWCAAVSNQEYSLGVHPLYRHVYASPEGWLAATDGMRMRRSESDLPIDEPTLLGGPPMERPYPSIAALFVDYGTVSVTVGVELLTAVLDQLASDLNAVGIEGEWDDDHGEDDTWFLNQEATPPTPGTLCFEPGVREGGGSSSVAVFLRGDSSRSTLVIYEGERRLVRAVRGRPVMILGPYVELGGERLLSAAYMRTAIADVPAGSPVTFEFQPDLLSPVRVTYRPDRFELIMPLRTNPNGEEWLAGKDNELAGVAGHEIGD